MARDSCSDDLLHTGVIISTSSTSEWHVTSVLGLRRVEIGSTVVFVGKRSYTVAVMPKP